MYNVTHSGERVENVMIPLLGRVQALILVFRNIIFVRRIILEEHSEEHIHVSFVVLLLISLTLIATPAG